MKLAAFALALLGGIVGTLVALFAIGLTFGSSDASSSARRFVLGFGSSAIVAALIGVVLASLYLAGKRPRLMAAGLIIAAIWHIASMRIIDISLFGLLGGLLMLLAALLAIAREWLGAHPPGTPRAATTGRQT